jgi:hypothetical protein
MTVRSTAAPVARPRPPAPKTHYQCWLEAGGGTVLFDSDLYIGLMRDAGILREPVPLTEVLRRVVERQADPRPDLEGFARILGDELGREGYRIHSISKCIRLAGDPLTIGRPMSPEEERQVGLWEGR